MESSNLGTYQDGNNLRIELSKLEAMDAIKEDVSMDADTLPLSH